ncbi:MAG: TonB family protein [Nitrospira sp.]|nr:TonB family protein [Nitrospira sp.]
MNRGIGRIPIRPDLRNWGCSLLLHVLFWGGAGWVWSQESVPPQREVFQWDVALVQSLSSQAERPVSALASRVVRQVSRPLSTPAADSAAAAHERTVEASRASAEPVTATPVIDAHPATVSGASRAFPSDRAIEANPMPSAAEDVLSHGTNDRPSPPEESAVAVSSANPAPVPPTDEAPAQLAVEASRETGLSTPVFRGEPQEVRAEAAAAAPAPAPAAAVSSESMNDRPLPPAPVLGESATAATGPAPVHAKPDFGWLMQTLWSRVAELKRYPHEARLNHWQGNVVVRAVIDEHGHLLEVTIATSSGHEALDRAAIEVIKRSCPLALPQPLGRSQVVLRVQIQYRLDS